MSYLDYALPLIKHFEGCRLTGYLDVRGIPTAGWGTTGSDITDGMCVTQQWADERLQQRVEQLEQQIDQMTAATATDNQMGALVSFAYNLGIGALSASTLLKLFKEGYVQGAADAFLAWNHVGNRVLAGLTVRREAERNCFLTGVLP